MKILVGKGSNRLGENKNPAINQKINNGIDYKTEF